MKEGIYLLQFRKCMDDNCCKLIVEPLPPPIPAPVLAPDGLHYLLFDDLYGKFTTTEEFCPSLKSKKAEKPKEPGYKYLSSRVVAALDCSLCGKPPCIFSLNSSLSVHGQLELQDIIFSCSQVLKSNSLYTARHLKCCSPIENAYNSSTISKKVQNTNVVFGKSTEPSQSKE